MKFIDRIEEIFIAITMFAAAALVFVNVALRFMGSGTTWSEELIRYLLIWMTFIGASVCIREATHISIDILPDMLRGRLKQLLQFFIYLFAFIFVVLFTYYSVKFVQFGYERGQITPGLRIAFYYVYLVLPVAGVLMSIRYLQSIWKIMASLIQPNSK